jgi:hypothetical protein
MWRSKKFIIIAVLVTVVLIGSIGGVVLAQNQNGDENQPEAQQAVLLEKVCAIYEENTGTAIDAQELQNAFAQAQSEMRDEALSNYLQKLVDEDKITQEQADQYKAWLESKPDVPLFEPSPFGFPGHGMHRGFGGPCGELGGWFGPPQPPE